MKLEMNRAWNQAMALIGANKDVVVVVAGVFFFLPYMALMIWLPGLNTMGADAQTSEAALQQITEFYAGIWWIMILLSIVQGIGMLGLMALLTDHRRPTVGEALRIGASKVLSYIGAYLLVGLGVGLVIVVLLGLGSLAGSAATAVAALLAVVLAVYVGVKLSLVPAVLVKEDVSNPITALRRSWELTRGNSLRLFFFYFLLVVTLFVLVLVVSIVLGLLLGVLGSEAQRFGGAAISSAMNAVWATGFLAVLSAVHDQLGGTSTAQIADTFE